MRYIIKISYDGSNYCGYQKQPNKITIQDTIENVMSKVFGLPVEIVASGRTDAGVSAVEQVCHFDLERDIDTRKVKGHINSLLPKDIRVLDIEAINNDFHARFSAKRKTYEYYFYVSREIIPVYDNVATLVGNNIDIDKVFASIKYFKGTHDFSAFSASNTAVVDKIRTIYDIEIVKIDEYLYKLVITGNGFLYNMVRIIMGTIVDVGMGKIAVENLPKIIDSCDRKQAGKTISAKGLYLKKVVY